MLDMNECLDYNGGCARSADCINGDGSYRCICDEGFEGNGYDCVGKYTHNSVLISFLCHL